SFGLNKLKHITCATHGLSLVAEEIRKNHPIVSKFISLLKQSMAQSVARKKIYRECSNSRIEEATAACLLSVSSTGRSARSISNCINGLFANPSDQMWEPLLCDSRDSRLWTLIWSQICDKNEPEPNDDDEDEIIDFDQRPLPAFPVK